MLSNKFRFSLFFVGVLLIFSSCNKTPESIGLDLVDHNKLPVFDTTFSVRAYSMVEDSVVTDETSINLLGSMFTENFGLTVASIYTHLRLLGLSPDFGENPQFDSAYLTLVYSGSYGIINTTQTIRIYEVLNDFYLDSTYYSNKRFDISNDEFTSFTFIPKPNDSVAINDSTKVTAQIRIPLNSAFGYKILTPEDSTVLQSNDNFVQYFKGIFITADSVNAAGEGAILYFDLLNSRSKVTIHYNDSLTYNLVFNQNTARVGNFYHNYAKSTNQNFRDQILSNDSSLGTQNIYLQGLAGIKSMIKIPDLAGWVSTNNYAINDAKLIIPVYPSSEELTPANRLVLFRINDAGNTVFTEDQLEGDKYFGGSYNESAKNYQFRISFYLQDLLNGTTDNGLVMLISGKTTNANEVIFYGTEATVPEPTRIELQIVYTRL